MLDEMLRAGELVAKFRIDRKLDEGGMGIVYAAQHVHTGARSAIKVLTPLASQVPEIVQRFHNEARAVASLNHDNIVRVLDAGRSPDTDDGRWFIALEFLDGAPLSHLIHAQRGPIAIDVQLKLMAQACAGIQAAHDAGIVHRDIKPGNLFVAGLGVPGADERVKVLDFGVAKLHAALSGLETRSQIRMGTPAYMAPEQLLDSKKVDGRADVFALAVIVYEMTTGVRPWGDETNDVMIFDMQKTQAWRRDPRNAPLPEGHPRPTIPPAWAEVLVRALDLDPDRRYATPRDFALALARAAPGTAWRADGMEIVLTYARSLTIAPVDGDTAGRSLADQAAALAPSPITAPARPAIMVSPVALRGPGIETPPLAGPHALTIQTPAVPVGPKAVASPGVPMTTLGGAATQAPLSVPSPRRRASLIALAAAGLTAGLAVAVVVLTREGDEPGQPSTPASALPPAAPFDAAAPMTALAVLSEPDGATISVDGVVRGTAPINLQVPVGAEITLRAELAGHDATSQSARVGTEPATVRLRMLPTVQIDAPATSDTQPSRERKPSRARTRDRDGRAASPVEADAPPVVAPDAGATKRAPTFNPDDMPGD